MIVGGPAPSGRTTRVPDAAWADLLNAEVCWTLAAAQVDALVLPAGAILVSPGSAAAALTALGKRGLRPVAGPPGPGEPEQPVDPVVLCRPDPDLGVQQVTVLPRVPGSADDPVRAWRAVWGRRAADAVAGVPAWFVDLPTAAMLVAVRAAGEGALSHEPVGDLAHALDQIDLDGWAEAAAVAREVGAAEAMRAGLSVLPAGHEIATQVLGDVTVGREWGLRAAGAMGAAAAAARLAQLMRPGRPARDPRAPLAAGQAPVSAPRVVDVRTPARRAGDLSGSGTAPR